MLTGLSGRIAHPRLTVGVVGGAAVLALALLALLAFPSGALAQTPTYASCSAAQTSFPGDLAAVSGSKTFVFPPDCTIDLSAALTVPAGTTVVIDGNGLILDQTSDLQDVIDINDSSTPGGTLTLDDVTVENGLYGVDESGSGATVQLLDASVTHNLSDGIVATTITMTGSTVSGNGATGIIATDATVTASTLSGNGVGIYSNAVTVTNSTITSNTVGIDAISQTSIISSTITDNTDEGIAPSGATAPVSLTATLLAGNGTNCDPGVKVTDAGYNRSTDSSCGFTSATSLPNASDTTPPTATQLNLLPLGNYGGPTRTMALGPGSTAIDQIPTRTSVSIGNQTVTICPATADGSVADQRGVARPQGSGCDIGSVEDVQTITTLLSNQCDEADLQTALNLAPPYAITTIDMPANCKIDLSSALQVGAGVDITINGNGSSLIGNATTNTFGTFDLIDIHDPGSTSTLDLNQLTLEDGQSGVIESNRIGTVELTGSTVSGMNGSAFSNGIAAGAVTLTNSTISGISTGQGGTSVGILAGAITLTDSTISGILSGQSGSSYGISGATARVTGSILANAQYNCLVATLIDGGYNLSTDTSCGFSGTSQQGSTVADGLNLLPLGNYGGPTPTIALGPGSIAIDQVPVGTTASIGGQTIVICPSASDPAFTDQRGIPRPQGDACDTGAYEAPALSLTVDPAQPNGSNGWYTTDPTVTLGYSGLAIGADSTDASQAQVASCSGLSHTATTLNDSGTVSLTISEEGTTAIGSCAVKQGTTALGFSTSGKTLFLTLKVDTTNPTVQCSPPGNYQTTWYDSNQTVKCTASDDISGLADSSLATFSLTTDVASGTVDATAATGTQQVCNNAGTCVIAGPYDFKIDLQDPTVQASAKLADGSSYAFGDWTNQAVTISFTANDGDGSGVKSISYTVGSNPTQTITGDSGSFTISDQGEYTISYVATDNAGNVSTTHSVKVDIDLHAPSITITSPKAQAYVVKATPMAGYTCAVAPGISPVTECSGTVTLPDQTSQTIADGSTLPTNELGSYSFVVNAENAAGNTSSQTVVYTVGYAMTALPGNTTTVNPGYYALIRFAPEDANGHDYASRTLKVTSVELEGNGQTIPFAYPFQYLTVSGEPGYQLALNTRNLSPGTWTLVVQIGTGAQATTGTITFTVE